MTATTTPTTVYDPYYDGNGIMYQCQINDCASLAMEADDEGIRLCKKHNAEKLNLNELTEFTDRELQAEQQRVGVVSEE